MAKKKEVTAGRDGVVRARDTERGAALITVLLMSMMLLIAGLGLIAVTSNSASLAADATSESQAFYAAEAGAQAVIGALRGNYAPLTTDANAANNKMSFRNAVTPLVANSSTDTYANARLSRWLPYSATASDGVSVVPISASYTAGSGMAYSVEEIKDPDNSDIVIFSTSGKFADNNSYKDFTCSSGCTGTPSLRLTYAPRGSSSVFTTTSGATNLGSFTMTASNNGTFPVNNVPFALTVTQTKPWAASKTMTCAINGTVTKSSTGWTSNLTVQLPTLAHSLDGVIYTLTYSGAPTLSVPNGSAVTLSATITPPDPQRLRVKVTGYGPRNAVKKIQLLVSMAAFDYNATGTITMRSHDDDTTAMTMSVGSSAVYGYNGNDNANGASLPAISVTGPQDEAYVNSLNAANSTTGSQIQGFPGPARRVPVSSLDKFLQTTDGPDGARAALDRLRQVAKSLKTPGCTGALTACDRYYASGESISNIGLNMTNGLMTFVEGDYTLPPAGGAGLLVVTGTLTMNGNADYKGLILVLGGGTVNRQGGGGDLSLLSMAVARFGSTGGFLNPAFNVSGGGNSTMRYDSDWVRKALKSMGPGVLGVSEY
jgi:Tfp pilus assembly protein PilX